MKASFCNILSITEDNYEAEFESVTKRLGSEKSLRIQNFLLQTEKET